VGGKNEFRVRTCAENLRDSSFLNMTLDTLDTKPTPYNYHDSDPARRIKVYTSRLRMIVGTPATTCPGGYDPYWGLDVPSQSSHRKGKVEDHKKLKATLFFAKCEYNLAQHRIL